MIEIPYSIREKFKNDGYNANFRITFPDDDIDEITNDNIVSKSVTLTESLLSESKLSFGIADNSVLEFECFDVPDISDKSISVFVDIDDESIPIGTFIIDSCEMVNNTSRKKCIAYGTGQYQIGNLTDEEFSAWYRRAAYVYFGNKSDIYVKTYQYDYGAMSATSPPVDSVKEMQDVAYSLLARNELETARPETVILTKSDFSTFADRYHWYADSETTTSQYYVDANCYVAPAKQYYAGAKYYLKVKWNKESFKKLSEILGENLFSIESPYGLYIENTHQGLDGYGSTPLTYGLDNVFTVKQDGMYQLSIPLVVYYSSAKHGTGHVDLFDDCKIVKLGEWDSMPLKNKEYPFDWDRLVDDNSSEYYDLYISQSNSFLTVLNDIAEANGTFLHVNRNGKYDFKTISQDSLYPADTLYPDDTLYPKGTKELVTLDMYSELTRNEISISISGVDLKKDTDWASEYYTKYPDGISYVKGIKNVYEIDNAMFDIPLTTTGNDIGWAPEFARSLAYYVVHNIYNMAKDLMFRKVSVKMVGMPYVESGDFITLLTKDDGINFTVMKRKLKMISCNRFTDEIEMNIDEI